jgi:hypothetical protein
MICTLSPTRSSVTTSLTLPLLATEYEIRLSARMTAPDTVSISPQVLPSNVTRWTIEPSAATCQKIRAFTFDGRRLQSGDQTPIKPNVVNAYDEPSSAQALVAETMESSTMAEDTRLQTMIVKSQQTFSHFTSGCLRPLRPVNGLCEVVSRGQRWHQLASHNNAGL